jgi:hypothetical protein
MSSQALRLPVLPPDPSDSAICRFVEGYERFRMLVHLRCRMLADLHYLDKMLGGFEGVEILSEHTRALKQRWSQQRADLIVELTQRGWLHD